MAVTPLYKKERPKMAITPLRGVIWSDSHFFSDIP